LYDYFNIGGLFVREGPFSGDFCPGGRALLSGELLPCSHTKRKLQQNVFLIKYIFISKKDVNEHERLFNSTLRFKLK
jgi:hypothetical protein